MPQYAVTMTRELTRYVIASSAEQAEDYARHELIAGRHPEESWMLTISAERHDGPVRPEPPIAGI